LGCYLHDICDWKYGKMHCMNWKLSKT
jgi:hypothetical protein